MSTPEWLTTEEVAAKIRMSSDYVARQCANGALKATRLGNEWRIHVLAVESFMSGNAKAAPARVRRRAS